MHHQLISTDGKQVFPLFDGKPAVIGRRVGCEIPIDHSSISRRHAELLSQGDGVLVRDLGSTNGTYVNGTRITMQRAQAGDVVTFGAVAFRLFAAPEGQAAAARPDTVEPADMDATVVRHLRVPVPGPAGTHKFSAAPAAGSRLAQAGALAGRVELKLEVLLAVARELSKTSDVDVLLGKIVRTTFSLLDADRVAILLATDDGSLVSRISSDRRGAAAGWTIPGSIARRVVQEKVAILSDNAAADQRFGGDSILLQQVCSAMCAPLLGSEGRVLGVLYVDNLERLGRFVDADLEFVVAFAGIVGVAIENGQFADRIRRETLIRSSFERYFAPGLAARIAGSPEAVQLGGERRTVAVLFSDIRNFTPLSETLKPEATATLLTEYFTEMVECVFRHGGTLDKFVGDAVMAQWGAPISDVDDADRAVDAAIDMMLALAQLNARWQAEGRPQLDIGIGINYGDAFAGNIGSERRMEYTLIGDTVNTASRVCSAARGGQILITEEVRRVLQRARRLSPESAVTLKGKASAVALYTVAY
jgi:adenylate cyclase